MRILSIIQFDLIRFSRDKVSLIVGLLFPIIFTIFTGMAFKGQSTQGKEAIIPVGIINRDNGTISKDIIEELKRDTSLELKFLDDKTLESMIISGNLEAGIIISKNFTRELELQQKPKVEILRLPSANGFQKVQFSFQNAYEKYTLTNRANKYLKNNNINFDIKDKTPEAFQKLKNSSKVVAVNPATGKKSFDDGAARSALGYMIMFVMYTIFFACGEILKERKSNTLSRLIVSPASRWEIIIGKFAAAFTRGFVQILILLIFGQYIMGLKFGNIFAALAFMALFLFCVVSLATFTASVLKSEEQMMAASSVLVMATSALGGCWWPLEIVPDFMQNIARGLPQYYAMTGMKGIIENGFNLDGTVLSCAAYLVSVGLLFILLTGARRRSWGEI